MSIFVIFKIFFVVVVVLFLDFKETLKNINESKFREKYFTTIYIDIECKIFNVVFVAWEHKYWAIMMGTKIYHICCIIVVIVDILPTKSKKIRANVS